jgi:hypothetical protein
MSLVTLATAGNRSTMAQKKRKSKKFPFPHVILDMQNNVDLVKHRIDTNISTFRLLFFG